MYGCKSTSCTMLSIPGKGRCLIFASLMIGCVGAATAAEARIDGHQLLVNGKPYSPFGMVAHCSVDEYPRLASLGVNSVHIDSVYLSYTLEDDGAAEVAALRDMLDAAHANGMTALVQFGGHYTPEWLFEMHPDCKMKRPDGTDGSGGWHSWCLNHSGAREVFKKYVEAVTRGIKDHPALITWCLWNEPHLYPDVDFHPSTIDKFQNWLQHKYNSIDGLNTAWDSEHAGFDRINAPAEHAPDQPVMWTDWMRFRQENYADFFRWQADVIRAIDPGHPITTKIVPFDSHSNLAWGRAVNTRLWADSFCDAVGFDSYPSLDETHKARWIADFMRGMGRGKPAWNTEDAFARVDSRGRPSPQTERSIFWMQFARGVSGRWFFLWSPKKDFYQRFTYPDGSVEPGMYALRDCSRQLHANLPLLTEAKMAASQVAVLHSMATNLHSIDDFAPTADQMTIFMCLYQRHIPFEFIGEDDLTIDVLKKYRALVVVGTRNISHAQLAGIEQFVEGGGHVLANARFGEFDDYGRKYDSYPPKWFSVRAKKWHSGPRRKVGTMTLQRQAVDHMKQPVDVSVVEPIYDSRPMHITKPSKHVGLPVGSIVGWGDLYGTTSVDQTHESLEVRDGGEVVAKFEDEAPAIVTTPRTMYIGRDTCWLSSNFADLVETFMLNAGVVRKAYARDGAGREVAPLDLVLNETPTQWVLYAINSSRTLRYDGLALRGVRIAMPGAGNPVELISGRRLKSIRDGVLHQVVLDFEEGEAKILVVDK
jgi:beta-galactosidase GanA